MVVTPLDVQNLEFQYAVYTALAHEATILFQLEISEKYFESYLRIQQGCYLRNRYTG